MKAFKYKIVKSLDELPEFDPEQPIFCDSESDGLYINTRLIQYYQPQVSEYVYVLDVNYFGNHSKSKTSAMYKRLGRTYSGITLEDIHKLHSKLWLVFYNGSYDQGLLRTGSREVDDIFYLSRIQFHLLDNFGLNDIVAYLFPHTDYYEGLDKSALQKQGFKPGPLSDEQYRYSAMDVYVLSKIWPIVQRTRNVWSYRIDKANLGYTARWQQIGLKIDEEERQRLWDEYETERIQIERVLPPGLNVNSWQQVRKQLGVNESNEEAMLGFAAEGYEYALDILKQRKVIKSLNFLTTYKRDRIYGYFNPYGARTGRWTCKGGDDPRAVNMQQIPRKLRGAFAYPEDSDRIFVGGDLPTAELRLAAAIYNDPNMVKAFKEGIDIHKLTAAADANIDIEDVTPEGRKNAKASNFGLLYGMKELGFISYAFKKYDIVYDFQEAKRRRDSWMNTYYGIARKIIEITNIMRKNKNFVVRTPGGRIVKPSVYTDGMNTPIQGAVSEVTKLWIHYIHKMHHTSMSGGTMMVDCGVPICNSKHDDVTLDIEKKDLSYWSELMDEAGKKTWAEYQKFPDIIVKDIPMDIEITHGRMYNDGC